MPRRNFTLIELLVVIACIMVLAGLIFSVGRPMQRRAKARSALNDITAIYNAFQQFKFKYQIFPGQTAGADTIAYDSALGLYGGSPSATAAGFLTNKLIGTLIREKMLALNYSQLQGDKDTGALLDPYKKPYAVIIDPRPQADTANVFNGTLQYPSGSPLKNFRWQESGLYIFSSAGYEKDTTKPREQAEFIYQRDDE